MPTVAAADCSLEFSCVLKYSGREKATRMLMRRMVTSSSMSVKP